MKTNTPVAATALPTIESKSHIGFSPAQVIVSAVGETFTVEVVVKDADKPVRGIMGNINFDPKIMECSAVDEGTFLSAWAAQNGGSTMLFPEPEINNTAGAISDGAQIMIGAVIGTNQDSVGGATGTGSFLKLTCKAKAVGVGKLTLDKVEINSDKLGGYIYRNVLGVVLDSGEVFVGVTPTPTPQGGSSSTGTPGSSTPTGSKTSTPTGGTAAAGTPTPTPGIANISNAVVIPVTTGEDGQTIGDLSNFIDDQGIITDDVLLKSQDNLIAVFIPTGSQALTFDNYPLREITIVCLDPVPEDVDTKDLIGCVYDIQPDGATFNPPAKLIIAVDPAILPKGVSINQLTVVNYDSTNQKWISIPGTVDKKAGTVSAPISHFSLYSMKAKHNLWGWVVLFLLLLMLALGLAYYYLRMKNRMVVVEDGGIRLLYAPVDNTAALDASEESPEVIDIGETDHQSNQGDVEIK